MPTISPVILGNRLPINLPEPQKLDNNSWLQVSATNNFAGGIRSNNLLYMWGVNNTYQVGDGTTLNQSLPVQVSNSSFSQISAGFDHSAALTSDNYLYMWGNNASTFIQTINYSWNSISSNGGHNLAIRNDGLLFTWGLNTSGQLGDDSTLNRSSPIQIGTSSYAFVAAGADHSLAVINKSLYAWGLNSFFQNGQGTTTANRSSPVLVTTAAVSFVSVSAGNQFNAYVLSDGSLYTFGRNNVYQLGDSTTTSRSNPVAIGTERSYVSVSAGNDHSLSIDTVGNLYVWGNNLSIFAPIPTTISSWTQISAGDVQAAALTTTGKAYFWGDSAFGQLGQGDTVRRSSPVQIFAGTSSFVQVASTQYTSASIDTAYRLYTWGINDYGQLGIGLTTNRSTPQQVTYLNKSWSQVTLSSRGEAYAIDTDNKLWSWGLNTIGQLGVVPNNSVTWSTLAVGSSFIVAIKSDGTLWAWGRNNEGQLGQSDTINRSLPTQIGSGSWKSVNAGLQSSFAIDVNDNLYGWGYNGFGNLGDNTTTNKSSPSLVDSSTGVSNYTQISATYQHTLAIDNLGRAWSWGRNLYGQLGINLQAGTTADRSRPVQVSFPAGVSVTQVSAGGAGNVGGGVSLAISTTNILYAWGYNVNGAVGDGTTVNKSSPVQIGTDSWSFVNSGGYNDGSFAIRNDGTLFAWGLGTSGALGLNDTLSRSSPVQVSGLPNKVTSATYTSASTSLLLDDGTIWGMGGVNSRSTPSQIGNENNYIFLADSSSDSIAFAAIKNNNYAYVWGNQAAIAGTGQTTINTSAPTLIGYAGASQPNLLDRYSSPTQVASTSSWSQIVAGDSYALAIDSNYKLFGWGLNSSSQVGDNTTINQYSPVQVDNNSWISVSAGVNHALAVRSDNTLWTWGSSTAIGLVVEPQSFITAASGNNNAYAIDVGGRLWAWGDNTAGQLGDLRVISRSSPVMVGFNVALPDNQAASNYTQVFAGNSFAFALDDNSKLFAWGDNSAGELGIGTTISRSYPLQVGQSSWSAIAAGTDHTVGLDVNSGIYGWGQYTTGQTGIYDTAYSWTQVAGGLALRADNTLWSWGENAGDGTTIVRSVPVQLGSNEWSSIAMIYDATYAKAAIKTNGTLWLWGTNTYGQLGDNTTISQSSPVQVAGSWSQISIQSNHAAALDSSSIMYTWGLNDRGQLGDGTTINQSSPVLLTATGGFNTTSWISVSVGYSHTTALNTSKVIYSWGDNSSGQLGINLGTAAHRSNPIILTGTSSWTMISSGALHVHGITMGALLFSWGSNVNGQTGLNVGTAVNRSSPTVVNATDTWYSVYAGLNYGLGIRRTGSVYSWGANNLGQLGQNDVVQRSSPTIIGALTSWIKVGANSATDNTNSAYVWGTNTGILSTIVASSSPVQVGGLRWPISKYYAPTKIDNSSYLQIGVGNSYSIGLNSDNLLYGWGLNTSGQLGDTTTVTKFSPAQLNSFSWLQIATGYDHALAIRDDTTLWTWGNSAAILLGVEPQSWTAISAGATHNLAIRSDGALFAWGVGTSGTLGDNSVINKSSPTVVGSSSWSQVAAGTNFSLALDVNNNLYTWGVTTSGQSGRIGVTRSNPTQVFNFTDKSSYSNTLNNFDVIYTSTDVPLTGSIAGQFRGGSQAITIPTGNEFAFGTGDFTLECWAWPNVANYATAGTALGYGAYFSEQAIRIGFSSYQFQIIKDVPNSTTGTAVLTTPIDSFNVQTWYHIAVVRQSGVLYAYINGVQRGSLADTTDYNPTIYGLRIGAYSISTGGGAVSLPFNGNISNVRVVKGVAVYTGNFTVPTSILTETQSAGTNISAITAGQTSLLALTDSTSISTPTYTSINAGASHAYAIDSTNKLFGWGLNTSGQVLPYGNYLQNTYNSSVPVQVGLGYYNNFTVGTNSAAGIRNPDRFIFTWGRNDAGQLGTGDTINRSVPTQIGNNSWKQIAQGNQHTLAIRDDDTLWGWGLGTSGQLGYGTAANRSSPVQVAGSWKFIAAGNLISAGIKSDGTLWTWGDGSVGILGDNTVVSKSSPVTVDGGGSWTSVSAGGSFMLAIKSNNITYAWGLNTSGQLGDGTTTNRSVPTLLASPFDTTSFAQVSAGFTHSTGITSTGLLYVWGGSSTGDLGLGSVVNRSNPTQVTQSTGIVGDPIPSSYNSWTFVEAGYGTTAAVNNSNLYVWGLNTLGRLGLGDTINRSYPTQTEVGYSWQSAKFDRSGNASNGGFFRSDNTIWFVGDNQYGTIGDNTTANKSTPVFLGAASFSTPVQINNSSWSSVGAGTNFTNAINSVGQLYNWGLNSTNQLGNYDTVTRDDKFVQITGSWNSIASGVSHSLAIKSDTTLWAWGGASAIVLSNVTVNSWTQIAGNDSSSHCAAIRSDGTLWVWGLNSSGQIGDSTTIDKSSPTQIGAGNWSFVSVGTSNTMAVKTTGDLYAWGNNASGQLGDNSVISKSSPVFVAYGSFTQVSLNGAYVLTLKSGTPYVWGLNSSGQLGLNDTINRSNPVILSSPTMVAMSASGSNFSLGITNLGLLYAWGNNAAYQLGDSTTANKSNPTQISTILSFTAVSAGASHSLALDSNSKIWTWGQGSSIGANFNSWTQIATGESHTLALRSDGRLFTWGLNTSGQLGQGDVVSRSNPVTIGASSWIFVTAGALNSFAIRADSTLWAWGSNTGFVLGDATSNNRNSPVQIGVGISVPSWKQVSAGTSHAIGIASDDRLYVWGTNTLGVLGLGDTVTRSSPTVLGSSSWTKISAGNTHNVAINSSGQMFAWGANNLNQLGDNTFINQSSPVQIGFNRSNATVIISGSWSQVGAGLNHSLAIDSSGRLYTWGNQNAILLIPQLQSWSQISAGDNGAFTLGIRSDGLLYGWGLNSTGQLGTFDTLNRSSPTLVSGLGWKRVATGTAHSLAIREDDTLWAWGNNATWQLGDGLSVNRSSPVQVGLSLGLSWASVAAGASHSAAINSLGKLYMWGASAGGAIGDNQTAANRSSPTLIGTSSWTSVSLGSSFTAAITSIGTLFAWGLNSLNQLGDATIVDKSSPVQLGSGFGLSFINVTTGLDHSAAITTDYKLYAWGSANGVLLQNSVQSWTKISAGVQHTVAVRSDGLLYAWGLNNAGQLGDSTTTNRSSPVLVTSDSSWSSVAAGDSHTLAIHSNGSVYAWGFNTSGQLGFNTTTNRSSPVLVTSLSSYTQVKAGAAHSLAIKVNGIIEAWGLNSSGELGQTDTINRSAPLSIGTSSWSAISAGSSYSIGIDINGKLYGWGLNNTYQIGDGTTTPKSNPVLVGGDASFSQINTSFTAISTGVDHNLAITSNGNLWTWGNAAAAILTRASGVTSWTKMAAGASHTLAIRSDGILFAWGLNNAGQLGDGTIVSKSSPTIIGNYSWNNVSAGQSYSFAIRSDNTMWAWGLNLSWQLGDQSSVNKSSPVQIAAGTDWSSVTGGSVHSMALDTLGRLYTWGQTAGGVLGTNVATPPFVSRPSQIPGSESFIAIAAGVSHSLAIRNDNTMWAWGTNTTNQLGDGTNVAKSSPVQVGALNATSWTQISSEFDHSLAIDSTSRLWVWGNPLATPLLTTAFSWSQISAGNLFTVAIRNDGHLFAWGAAAGGALGDGQTAVNRSSPVLIGANHSWSKVSAGTSYAFAIKADSTLWAWGLNSSGQLGDNSTISKSSPVLVSTGASSYTQINAGSVNNLAIDTNFRVWSWGLNNAGQLGNGTTTNRSNPALVNTTIPSTTSSYTQISAGNSFAAVIDTANELFMFGLGSLGRLGNNSTINRSRPVIVRGSASFYTQVASGFDHTLALAATTSRLFSWGNNNAGQLGTTNTVNRSNPAQVSQPASVGSTSWGIITAGNSWSLGSIDNKIYAWGLGSSGQLGTNTSINRSQPTIITGIGSSSWTVISAGVGGTHAVGIQSTGLAYGFGLGTSGQVGDYTLVTRSAAVQVGSTAILNSSFAIPTQVGTSSWTAVNAGTSFSLAILSNNNVYAWGLNSSGQLGNNTSVNRSSPTLVANGAASFIMAGGAHGFAWSNTANFRPFGLNNAGQLGINDTINRSSATVISLTGIETQFGVPTRINNTLSWTSVSAGQSFSLAVPTTGALYAWGVNSLFQLGDNTSVGATRSSPTIVATGNSWTVIAAGKSHSTAIKTDNTIYAWGSSVSGQIGDNATVNRSSPTQIGNTALNTSVPLPTKVGDSSWTQVAAGNSFTSAIRSDFTIWSWGLGTNGQLGNNSAVSRSSPVQISGAGTSSWTQVVAGGSHALAISTTNLLYGWGLNTSGQLGDITVTQRNVPTIVSPTTIAASQYPAPTLIDNTNSYVQVAAGNSFSAALRNDYTLYVWGLNNLGQLGDNTSITKSSPVLLAASTVDRQSWTLISTMATASGLSAISNQKVFNWGLGTGGQLGDNSSITKSSPVQVFSTIVNNLGMIVPTKINLDISFTQISAGTSYSVARKATDNTMIVWGTNQFGQYGDGTTVSTSYPVMVGQSPIVTDNSQATLTVTTPSGTPKSTIDSPFDSGSYNVSTYGGSLYLNGSSRGLIAADSTLNIFASATGSSLEIWFKPTATGAAQMILAQDDGTSTAQIFQLFVTSANFLSFTYFTTTARASAVTLTSTVKVNVNSWNHALVTLTSASSGILRIFLNGNFEDGTLGVTPYAVTARATGIGSFNGGVSSSFTGFLTNLRIVNGSIPIDYQTALIIGLIDKSNFAASVTNNSVTFGTALIPFAGATAAFFVGNATVVGSNSYLTIPNAAGFQFGTGDFTVEFFMRKYTTYQAGTIIGLNTASLGNWGFIMSGGSAVWQNGYTVNSLSSLININANFPINTWKHVAIVRISSTTSIYIDGTLNQSFADTTNYNGTGILNIGSTAAAPYGTYEGYLSNLRIVKGVGVYTGTFTSPSSPLAITQSAGVNIQAITGSETSLLILNDPSSAGTGPISSVISVPSSPLTETSQGATSTDIAYLGMRAIPVYTTSNVVAIGSTTAFLDTDGTIDTFGLNASGQFGNGTTINRSSPVVLGQNFTGLNTGFNVPVQVITQNSWTAVSAGNSFSLAKNSDTFTYAWGLNTSGQLGRTFSLTTRSAPAIIGPNQDITVLDVSSNSNTITGVGTYYTLVNVPTTGAVAGTFNGTIDYLRCDAALNGLGATNAAWTIEGYVNPSILDTNTYFVSLNLKTTGANNLVLGVDRIYYNGSLQSGASFTFPVNTWTHFAATTDGLVFRYFINGVQVYSGGQPSNGISNCVFLLGAEADGADAGALGNYFNGALSSVRVTPQQLYTGAFTPPTGILTTTTVGTSGPNVAPNITGTVNFLTYTTFAASISIEPAPNFNLIAAGAAYALGTQLDNTLYAWGLGSSGQLGIGSATSRSSITLVGATGQILNTYTTSPVQVLPGTSGYTQVFAGQSFSILQDSSGIFYTWGLNSSGQLADEGTIDRSAPSVLGVSQWNVFDESTYSTPVTKIGTFYSTAIIPFTGAISGTFTSPSYLTLPTNYLNFLHNGSTDYTVELYFYTSKNASNLYNGLLNTGPATNNKGFNLQLNTNVARNASMSIASGGGYVVTMNSGSVYNVNAWNHIAITCVASTRQFSMYVNGVLVDSAVASAFVVGNATNDPAIGNYQYTAGERYFSGYISNFRIVKKVVYTGNFTVPTSPLQTSQSAGTNISSISASETHFLIYNVPSSVITNPSNINFTNFNVKSSAVNAIASDNKLYTWGANPNGQLGIGSIISRSSPVIIGNGEIINTGTFSPVQISFGLPNSWSTVAAGKSFSLARDISGSVYAWGLGTSGQLDNQLIISRSSPTIVGSLPSYYNSISAGGSGSMAISTDSLLYTWGLGTSGQLGIDNSASRSSPVLVGNQLNSNTISPILAASASWSQASAGASYSLALNSDGSIWGFGLNNTYQLGQGDLINRSSIVQVGSGVTPFTDQSANNFTITSNGNAYMLAVSPFANGSYDVSVYGGSGSFDGTGDYITVPGDSAFSFASGDFCIEGWFYNAQTDTVLKTLAGIYTSGTNDVTSWQILRNLNGNDGRISLFTRLVPSAIITSTNSTGLNIWFHLAITRSGTTMRMFIDGALENTITSSASIGNTDTLYIGATSDTVVSFPTRLWVGYISNFRIVKGSAVYTSAFTPSITPLTAIAGTSLLTCFYLNSSLLYSIVEAGNSTSMAIKADGSLYTWGLGTSGILGGQSVVTRSLPAQVGTASWSSVSTGTSHATALSYDNNLFAWGGNSTGQLGTNTTVTRSSPVQVQGINLNTTSPTLVDGAYASISAGLSYTAGINANSLYIWGLNSSGQVGDGTTITKSSPTLVGNAFAITDGSANNYVGTITGAATVSTSVIPIVDTMSVYLPSTSHLTYDNATNLQFGTGAFTIESFIRFNNNVSEDVIVSKGSGGVPNTGYSFYLDDFAGTKTLRFIIGDGAIDVQHPTLLVENTWYYVAVTRDSSSDIRLFVNGISSGVLVNTTYDFTQTSPLRVGIGRAVTNSLDGYISNLRIIKGTALYTSNFTVPTTPLTAVSGTQLLLATTPPTILYSSVTAGSAATYGILSDGNLYAWGLGNTGQISGFAETINRSNPNQIGNQYISLNMSSPVLIAAGSWSSISAGISSSAAIRNDYQLFTWGLNTVGKLGDSTTILKSSPVQIGTSSWTQVSASASHTAAIDIQGRLFTWGLNSSGQLGLTNVNAAGDVINRSSPVLVGNAFTDVLDVSTYSHTITQSGTSFSETTVPFTGTVSGSFPGGTQGLTIPANSAFAIGDTGTIEFWYYRTSSVTGGKRIISFSPGSITQLDIFSTSGAIGISASGTNPVTTFNIPLYTWYHVAIVINSGLLSFYFNGVSQSYTGTTGGFNYTTVSSSTLKIGYGGTVAYGLTGAYLSNIRIVKGVAVYTGNFTVPTSVLTVTQSAGANISAITGTQTSLLTYTTKAATIVGGEPAYFNEVAVGQAFTAATNISDILFMWGLGSNGILGNNAAINLSSPIQVTGVGTSSWTSISAGNSFTGGIQSNGELYMWGNNAVANFGDIWYNATSRSNPIQFGNTYASTANPTRVPIKNGNSSWTQVSAGNSASIGLFYRSSGQNGLLFTWGLNSSGQLGDNTTINKSSPVQIGVNTYLSVTTGTSNAGAIGKATT